MITNKKHNQIIEHKDKTINDYLAKIMKLEKELDEARRLEKILDKISDKWITSGNGIVMSSHGGLGYELSINENVAQYVDDYFGGKVIKQEATKLIEIAIDGKVGTAYTKQKPDKGYKYKLIRKDLF